MSNIEQQVGTKRRSLIEPCQLIIDQVESAREPALFIELLGIRQIGFRHHAADSPVTHNNGSVEQPSGLADWRTDDQDHAGLIT